MTHFVLSTLLSFAGVAAALAVLLAAGALVKLGGKPRAAPSLHGRLRSLRRLPACRPRPPAERAGLRARPGRTVLLHGALLAVHLVLLGGLLRRLRQIAS